MGCVQTLLAGIDLSHVEDHPQDAVVTLPKSKTDQEAAGRLVPLQLPIRSPNPEATRLNRTALLAAHNGTYGRPGEAGSWVVIEA